MKSLHVLSAAILTQALSAFAADGRIEINQALIEAEGGFPYTIDAPGSYLLTGPLVAPASSDALVLDANDISLDLNGFSITGPATCAEMACVPGDGSGIDMAGDGSSAHRVTIRNGVVRGFGGHCIVVNTSAIIEKLVVNQCGLAGIVAGDHSILMMNHVSQTALFGLSLSLSAQFAHNNISQAGLAGGNRAVEGGKATAGNFCDDGSCTPRGERRFYLSTTAHNGANALTACAPGFHMASIWEIFDSTQLSYDTFLGITVEDSGMGPPTDRPGWIRTGKPDNILVSTPGGHSCMGYSTTEGLGTTVRFSHAWGTDFSGSSDLKFPWFTGSTASCNSEPKVWCVED